MQQQKTAFVTKLADLVAGRNEMHWKRLLVESFFFCRDCNQKGIAPTSLFTAEEREQTDKQISDALPRLERDLQYGVGGLGLESAAILRQVRSGLEFIRENFAVDNAWLKQKMDEAMTKCEARDFDEKLEAFKEERAEYDDGNDPVDLRGVPDNHSWWSSLERGDSVRVFGTK